MELKHSINDYTEAELLGFVKETCKAEGTTEKDDNKLVREFERLIKRPGGLDLTYYSRSDRKSSPEGIVKEIKEWRAASSKLGFGQG